MANDNETLEIVELEENLSDIEKPPELPNGTYEGEVQDVQVATSGAGNEYYNIRIQILPEEIPEDMKEFFEEGATLSWNRQLVPTGKDRRILYNLKKMLEAMGLQTNVTTINPDEWMGRPVRVQLKQSKYQGEMRAGITGLLPSLRSGEEVAEAEVVDDEPEPAPAPVKKKTANRR